MNSATNRYNRLSEKPTWLGAELTEAKRLMPKLDLHVMFGDELPHTDEMFVLYDKGVQQLGLSKKQFDRLEKIQATRLKTLTGALTERFGSPAVGKTFATDLAGQDARLASSICIAAVNFKSWALENNCGETTQRQARKAPTQAFIMLAPASFDSVSALALSSGFNFADCEHNSPHTPQLPDFVHERGHLEMMVARTIVTPWTEEYKADLGSKDRMWAIGRPDLATRQLLMRAATNFLSAINEDDSTYWSTLSQDGHLPYSASGILRDKRATLELKMLCARQFEFVDSRGAMRGNELQQMGRLLSSRSYAGFRELFSPLNPDHAFLRKSMMHGLDRVVEEDKYAYPETRVLAHLTRHALHAFFPSVMADKARYSKLLKKSAPAP